MMVAYRLLWAWWCVPSFGNSVHLPFIYFFKVKYSLETAAANQFYTELVAGQSLEWTHNLGGVYNFSETGASTYTIAPAPFTEVFTNVLSNGTLSLVQAVTDTSYAVELTGNLAPANYAGQEHYRRAVFQRCTPAQKTVLVRAYKNAQTYATSATSYLKKIKSGTTRYTTWFGQYTTTRKNLVLSRFTVCFGSSVFGSQSVAYNKFAENGQWSTCQGYVCTLFPTLFLSIFLTLIASRYDCTCTEPNAYAYVYREWPYNCITMDYPLNLAARRVSQ